MTFIVTVVGLASLLCGFLAGFTTFRRSWRWCGDCGRALRCLNCSRIAQHEPRTVGR